MKYLIGHHYKDPCGRGAFFLLKDNRGCSFGIDPDNIIFEGTLAEALEEAKKHNRPNTTDNWEPFPTDL